MPARHRLLIGLGTLTVGLVVAEPGAGAGPPSRAGAGAAGGGACTTYFVASVRRGPHAATDYAGVLTARLDARGRFRGGSFVPLEGGRVAVAGRTHGRGISLVLRTGQGTLAGTGSVRGSLARCVGTLQGRLRGPGRRDRGSWLATTGQTLQLPGGAVLFTSAETSNHPNPQVVYRAPNLGPATVYAGAMNTTGNLDGPRLAARMNRPSGLGYDADRSLVYVADVSNASIRRLDLNSGQLTTTIRSSDVVAAARAAGYPGVTGWEPQGVGVVAGASGALLIADVRNYVIWRYNPATLAFKLFAGLPGAAGHAGGSDRAVRFSAPQQIMVGGDGLIAVAEPTAQRVRLRDPGSGSWSTIGVCC
jgi:hypothetical protein